MPGRDSWTALQNREFVAAIYEVGIRLSSPSVILENMTRKSDQAAEGPTITSERVKSHLQKYRNNREIVKQEFMESYDSWLQKAVSLFAETTSLRNKEALGGDPAAGMAAALSLKVRELLDPSNNHGSGEVAASLSFKVTMQQKKKESNEATVIAPKNLNGPHPQDQETVKDHRDDVRSFLSYENIEFPNLTEVEKTTALGKSLAHVKKLLSILHGCAQSQRAENLVEGADSWSSEYCGPILLPSKSPSVAPSPSTTKSSMVQATLSLPTDAVSIAVIEPAQFRIEENLREIQSRQGQKRSSQKIRHREKERRIGATDFDSESELSGGKEGHHVGGQDERPLFSSATSPDPARSKIDADRRIWKDASQIDALVPLPNSISLFRPASVRTTSQSSNIADDQPYLYLHKKCRTDNNYPTEKERPTDRRCFSSAIARKRASEHEESNHIVGKHYRSTVAPSSSAAEPHCYTRDQHSILVHDGDSGFSNCHFPTQAVDHTSTENSNSNSIDSSPASHSFCDPWELPSWSYFNSESAGLRSSSPS